MVGAGVGLLTAGFALWATQQKVSATDGKSKGLYAICRDPHSSPDKGEVFRIVVYKGRLPWITFTGPLTDIIPRIEQKLPAQYAWTVTQEDYWSNDDGSVMRFRYKASTPEGRTYTTMSRQGLFA